MSFCDPKQTVLQLGLREGMRVGDFGAGSGHYALMAAKIVGDSGRVYAVDVQEDVLRALKNQAASKGLQNIEIVWGDFERPGGTKLKDDTLDAVILSNTLFQVDLRGSMVDELKRVMKRGARLLVVDWAGSYDGLGPPKERIVSEYAATELFVDAGFHKVKDFRAGPHHYSIVFTAP